MNGLFSAQGRELLRCPHCTQSHPEDLEVCPNSGRVILLDHKYRLRQLIGEGSFGLVWDARNIDTHKEVAIKALRPDALQNPAVLARFLWEATAAGRVHDPHVCDVLDLVKSSAHGPYIVLERLSGRSLESLLKEERRLPPERATLLIRQALVGLAAVHRAGIVHRDMKPENIFLHELPDGRLQVKLLDFGISKFTAPAGAKAMTAADLFLGTPEYSSPEQARGAANVDLRTDIWAVGAILYRALTGVAPFDGPDLPSVLTAILHAEHRPIAELAPEVPSGLAAVVDRCLRKDREQRFADCTELRAALAPFEDLGLAHTELAAPGSGHSGPLARPRDAPARAAGESQELIFSLADEDQVQLSSPRLAAAPAGDFVLAACRQADRRWLDHLREQFVAHPSGAQVTLRDFAELDPVRDHDGMVDACERARAIVLLVSPEFLAEDFAPGGHLYSMAVTAHGRGVPVLWVALREGAQEAGDLADFRALGDPAQPLAGLSFVDADRGIGEVCDQIFEAIGLRPARAAEVTRTSLGAARAEEALSIEQRIEVLKARKARFEALGEDTRALRDELVALRRAQRLGRPLQRGDVLDDRFLVLDQLGAGGFATVWRGVDQTTGAAVALKVLHAQHVQNAERRERFFRGARIMAQLDHPNIVKIVEPYASDGEYECFAMQFIAGGTLRDAVLGGRFSSSQRLRIVLAIADALAYAHERGIIHRDVKPTNILVTEDGTPYLSDFDLVRAEDTTGGTAGGFGTVIYAAPEMMESASEADARADVYGLGMTLAFTFYEKDLTMEVIRSTDRLIDGLKIPEAIRMIIRTAITWNRDHRFRSAIDFRNALAAALARRDSLPPGTRSPSGTLLAPSATAATTAPAPAPLAPPPSNPPAPSVSLIKAFAEISKESDALGERAVSEVFAALVVDEGGSTRRGSQSASLPIAIDDETAPDKVRRVRLARLVLIGVGVVLALALVSFLLAA